MPNYEFLLVRGIPVPKVDVYLMQEKLGAQLFDESCFSGQDKKIACINIIYELDTMLRRFRENNGGLMPDAFDINDPGWIYIPVEIFDPDTGITTAPSKNKPVGLVGWFRAKKYHRVSTRRAL